MENQSHYPYKLQTTSSPEMTDRALLGLPEYFTETCYFMISKDTYHRLINMEPMQWISLLDKASIPFSIRFYAGKLLAELGDPRVIPESPCMIDIPRGIVKIGLPAEKLESCLNSLQGLCIDRKWIEKEVPQHCCYLPAYRIAKYPVTNIEFKLFLSDILLPVIPKSWGLGRYPHEISNHPVYGITPESAEAYAHWLSKKTGRKFRLPSEYEWEYAAAGPANNEFPWGNQFIADFCNTAESGILCTTPVGLFPQGASFWGCLDMSGNVEEFVSDSYSPYPGGNNIEDDLVTKVGKYHRIARGGSFSRFRDLARTRRRHGDFPRSIYAIGFRLAESY